VSSASVAPWNCSLALPISTRTDAGRRVPERDGPGSINRKEDPVTTIAQARPEPAADELDTLLRAVLHRGERPDGSVVYRADPPQDGSQP